MARSRRRTGSRVPPTTAAPARTHDGRAARATAFDDRLAIVLAFFGSGCLLILEIVAGRLLAPTLGVSLYTWTSVIGVVLAGVSLGNYLGGRLADSRPTRSTVALIYVAASAATLVILGLVHYVDTLELPSGAPGDPAGALAERPALLRAVDDPRRGDARADPPLAPRGGGGGRVVGRIQAAASAGSIAGTFLTGFFLISEFGTRRIVAGVALTLLLLAIVARPPWLGARVYELGSLGAVILVAGSVTHSSCLRESDYYCIKVVNVTFDVPQASGKTEALSGYRALFLDRLLHGVSYLREPARPLLPVRARVRGRDRAAASERAAAWTRSSSAAARTRSRATWRRSTTGRSSSPRSTRRSRRSRASSSASTTRAAIDVHNEDARKLLRSLPADERFDFVLGDTFNDFEVPYHLTTRRVQRPARAAPEARRALHDERDRQRALRLPALGDADAAEDVPVRRRDRARRGAGRRSARTARRTCSSRASSRRRRPLPIVCRRASSTTSCGTATASSSRTTTPRSTSSSRRRSSRRSRGTDRQRRAADRPEEVHEHDRDADGEHAGRTRPCRRRSPISGIARPSEPSASGIIGGDVGGARASPPLRAPARAPLDLGLDPVGEAVDELRLELVADLLAGGERRLELVPELLLLGHSRREHTAREDLL